MLITKSYPDITILSKYEIYSELYQNVRRTLEIFVGPQNLNPIIKLFYECKMFQSMSSKMLPWYQNFPQDANWILK